MRGDAFWGRLRTPARGACCGARAAATSSTELTGNGSTPATGFRGRPARLTLSHNLPRAGRIEATRFGRVIILIFSNRVCQQSSGGISHGDAEALRRTGTIKDEESRGRVGKLLKRGRQVETAFQTFNAPLTPFHFCLCVSVPLWPSNFGPSPRQNMSGTRQGMRIYLPRLAQFLKVCRERENVPSALAVPLRRISTPEMVT